MSAIHSGLKAMGDIEVLQRDPAVHWTDGSKRSWRRRQAPPTGGSWSKVQVVPLPTYSDVRRHPRHTLRVLQVGLPCQHHGPEGRQPLVQSAAPCLSRSDAIVRYTVTTLPIQLGTRIHSLRTQAMVALHHVAGAVQADFVRVDLRSCIGAMKVTTSFLHVPLPGCMGAIAAARLLAGSTKRSLSLVMAT